MSILDAGSYAVCAELSHKSGELLFAHGNILELSAERKHSENIRFTHVLRQVLVKNP